MAREIKVGGLRIDIGVGFEELRKGLDSVEKRLQNFGKSLNNITKQIGGPKLELGIKASFGAIGAIALKAGKDFDDAQAKIIRSTGAAGVQLDQFKTSLVNAFAGNDDSVQEVAAALAEVSQKTGLAGASLEKLTGKLLDLNDITGQDTSSLISSSAKLFESWGVSVADQTKTLDLFLAANQKFGINFGQLEETLQSSGATLRQLGFSLEDSTVLLANMSQAGVNVDNVLAGLKKGFNSFIEKGKSPQESLQKTLDILKELGNEKNLKALKFGKDVFGKSFVDVFDAVKRGAFDIETAKKKLGDFEDQVAKTAETSQTLGQKLSVFWNNITTILAPFGTAIVDLFKGVFDWVNFYLTDFAKKFNTNAKLIGVFLAGITDDWIEKFKITFEYIYLFAKVAFDRIIDYVIQVGTAINNLNKTIASVALSPAQLISGKGVSSVSENYDKLKESLAGIGQQGEATIATLGQIEDLKKRLGDLGFSKERLDKAAALRGEIQEVGKSAESATKPTGHFGNTLGNMGGDADKAAESLKKFNKQISDLKLQNESEALAKNFERITKSIQTATKSEFADKLTAGATEFNSNLEVLKENVRKKTLEGFDEAFRNSPEAQKAAAEAAEKAATEMRDKLGDAVGDTAVKFGDDLKNQIKAASDFFTDALYNVFTGQSFNLEDMGKRFAAGIAGGILGGLFPGAGEFGDLQGIGKVIGQELIGGLSDVLKTEGKGLLSDIFGGTGEGGFLSNLFGGGEAGAAGGGSLLTAGIAAAAAATAALVYDQNSNNIKGDNKTKTGATLALDSIFPGIGSGLSKLGAFGGDGKDPQSAARDDAMHKLTEAIEKFGKVDFFDSQGKLQSINKLNLGDSSQFNAPGWATELEKQFGANSTNAFSGIGEALRQTLGITEDIGSQIGAMLLQSVGGSIDGLKGIISATGLTYESFIDVMITDGKKGQDSWLSIISQINAGTEAFQKGLSGTGKFVQAFQNVLATAGKGGQALTQTQAIAVEAREAGITALTDLQSKLVESGKFTKIEIDALFNGFAQQNIKTLDDLEKATDLQLASIVASIDAYFQDNGKGWENIREQISQTSDDIAKINGKNIQLTFDVRSTLDDSTKALIDNGVLKNNEFNVTLPDTQVEAMASGGILKGPTMIRPGALAGEAGPEAVLPLKSINGKLGVAASGMGKGAAGITINIDARNAQRGVEADIINALDAMEERILNSVHSSLGDY